MKLQVNEDNPLTFIEAISNDTIDDRQVVVRNHYTCYEIVIGNGDAKVVLAFTLKDEVTVVDNKHIQVINTTGYADLINAVLGKVAMLSGIINIPKTCFLLDVKPHVNLCVLNPFSEKEKYLNQEKN